MTHNLPPRRQSVRAALNMGGGMPVMPDLAGIIFWILAITLVGSSLAVVIGRKIVHSALFLVLVFGAAAGIFVLFNAEFIAIVQVLIYARAITVLILFPILLAQPSIGHKTEPFN